MLEVVICARQVLDPDAVNNYAIFGKLQIDSVTKEIQRDAIPLLTNAYDEQAIEAALKLKDAGVECNISVVTVGGESNKDVLKHAFSMGADRGILLMDDAFEGCDGLGIASILSKAINKIGEVGLVLCGRQASDDDQGIVGPALAGMLDIPCVSIAKSIEISDGNKINVVRVMSDGDEHVEVDSPALVTVSNEIGEPRYPSLANIMAARKKEAEVWTATDLELGEEFNSNKSKVVRESLSIPEIQASSEFIDGSDVGDKASKLIKILEDDGVL